MYSIISEPRHGKISKFDKVTGTLLYEPYSEFSGDDSFTFKVSDEVKANSNTAKVNIKVEMVLTQDDVIEGQKDTGVISKKPGTENSSPVKNHKPMANAGRGETIYEDSIEVFLNGTGKDLEGDKLTYTWEQIGGPRVELENYNTQTPMFSAPHMDRDANLKFRLTVTDTKGNQDSDELRITIKDRPSEEIVQRQGFSNQTR